MQKNKTIAILFAIGLLGATQSPAAAPILGGTDQGGTKPRHVRISLPEDPSRAMTIGWDTPGYTDGVVDYGLSQGDVLNASVQAVSRENTTSPYMTHEATLEGLAPDTAYAFRVGSKGTMSETRTFKTAPVPGTGQAAFVVLGDSRNDFLEFNQDRWKTIADVAAQEPIDFSLHTGDYTLTSVSPFGWEWFFDAGANLFAKAPFMAVHGNHEMYAPTFDERFAMPGNERYYSFDYGPIHVAVLDTDDRLFTALFSDYVSASDFGPGSKQYEWLKQDLAAVPEGMWKVVALHRPPYSASEHGDQKDVQALVPLFEQFGVDVVFSGHDHGYQRSQPMRGGQAAQEGPIYIVTAGAGAPTYKIGKASWLAVSKEAFHYVFVRATPKSLSIQAKTPEGSVIDELELKKE